MPKLCPVISHNDYLILKKSTMDNIDKFIESNEFHSFQWNNIVINIPIYYNTQIYRDIFIKCIHNIPNKILLFYFRQSEHGYHKINPEIRIKYLKDTHDFEFLYSCIDRMIFILLHMEMTYHNSDFCNNISCYSCKKYHFNIRIYNTHEYALIRYFIPSLFNEFFHMQKKYFIERYKYLIRICEKSIDTNIIDEYLFYINIRDNNRLVQFYNKTKLLYENILTYSPEEFYFKILCIEPSSSDDDNIIIRSNYSKSNNLLKKYIYLLLIK